VRACDFENEMPGQKVKIVAVIDGGILSVAKMLTFLF
jgi:hypothetical protein